MPTTSVRRGPLRSRGFTATEGLLASVVLAASVISIATAVNVSYDNSARTDDGEVAVALARQLMEQLASLPFSNATATRDSVQDYENYSDTTSPLVTPTGVSTMVGRGNNYTRTVRVGYRVVPPTALMNSAVTALQTNGQATPMAVVVVTVRTPSGKQFSLSQLFTNSAGATITVE